MPAADLLLVGDVQGCRQELGDLLARAGFDERRHRLGLVGDLVNRGPESRAVLELARRLDALVVLGNHEDGLLAGKAGETLDRVRAELGGELGEWLRWIASWPLFVREPGLIVVHGGIAPGRRPEECSRRELTRLREVDGRPWFESWRGPETVVFGHWSLMGKVDRPLCKGLDTGCVYGGALTGLWWPRCEWVQVPARRRWFEPSTMRPLW
jgi:diadenosine tetraphosphatase ApaH/serine/threonine PP2A family protein phosphatase